MESVFDDERFFKERVCDAVGNALKPGMNGQKAAKAVYEALKPLVVEYGQDPKWELSMRGPGEGHYAGACWLVCWEAGPYEWGIPASFAACNASGKLCEPYYSFDLCFYEKE